MCDETDAQSPVSLGNHVMWSQREEKMKAMKRQCALIPFVILLGFVDVGAVRADPTSFKVPLTGAQCVPPVDTTGSGTAELTYDPATRVVTWNIAYSGLSSATTMAHFHGPAKQGQNAPVADMAQHTGHSAHEPHDRYRHAHPGPGEAVHGRRVVYQCSYSIPPCRGDPRSGDSSQELKAKT